MYFKPLWYIIVKMTKVIAWQQTSLTKQSNVLWLKQHQTELRDLGFSYISSVRQPVTLIWCHLLHLPPPAPSSIIWRRRLRLSRYFLLAPKLWQSSMVYYTRACKRVEWEKLQMDKNWLWLHQFYRERSRQPASTQQIIPNSFVV